MRSYHPLIVGAVLAALVQGSPDHEPIHARVARDAVACKPTAGSCSSCGATWAACGTDACYNPVAGDVCCSDRYACPSTFNCASTGIGCIPRNGKPRECPKELTHLISTSTSTSASSSASSSSSSTAPSTSASTTGSLSSTSSSTTTDSTTDSSLSSSSSTASSTTNVTITITSTTTSTVTVTNANQPTGACAATNPLTTSAPYGNFSSTSIVALNTTTSTLSVTNLSSTPPVTISPISVNTSKPTATIVPTISGFKGAAGRSETSLFALGSLVFVAALLI